MTSCRSAQWGATSFTDHTVSSDVSGIDEGVTVVFRLRESNGRRVEVALGRTAVKIREYVADAWRVERSEPRQSAIAPAEATVTAGSLQRHRVRIYMLRELVRVELDGEEIARGLTTVTDGGLFSIGAITTGAVAARFHSVHVTDSE